MFSKTQWLIRVGIVSLTLVISVVPLAAQRVEVPAMRFLFAPEPDEARDLFNEGRDFFDKGKYAEAEKRFREVVTKHPKNAIADRSDYYLIRTLSNQRKVTDALSEIAKFERVYAKSDWLEYVQEERIKLTSGTSSEVMTAMALAAARQAPAPPARPAAPGAPTPPPAPAPPAAPAAPSFGGRAPVAISIGRIRQEENPEVLLQQEALRVLFENNADRALEIANDRLKADPTDRVILNSLYMVAQSKSDKALPLLLTLAKTSPSPQTRREALLWISRSRGEKDAIADLLISLVPSMTADEDSSALASALGQINSAKAFDALASMARDKNKPERMRLNAIQSIGDARLVNRVALLDDIYKASMDNPRVRRTVVNYLIHAKDPQIVDVLARIIANDPDINVRREALNSLGQVKTPEAMKALESVLTKKPQ